MAYHETGRLDLAIRDLNAALTIEPGNADLYYNRGMINDNAGNSARAVADFSKAIELAPEEAAAYANRGLAFWRDGQLEEALRDFLIAIKLDPDGEAGAVAKTNMLLMEKQLEPDAEPPF
jgi:tetratricopeptide (TPR) repeat protein